MKKLPAFICLCLAVAACAKSPDAIAPVSLGDAYAKTSCKKARAELAAEKQVLAALEDEQRDAVTGDAIGVFLIGVPISSLSGGDKAGEIATSKGKVLALEGRLTSC